MSTLLYNVTEDNSTTPSTYIPEAVSRTELSLEDIAVLINAFDPAISANVATWVIVGLKNALIHNLNWGNWGQLEGFATWSSDIATILLKYSDDIDENDFSILGDAYTELEEDISDVVVYELNDIIAPLTPYIAESYDSDNVQNYVGYLKGLYLVGTDFQVDSDQADEGVFLQSVLGTRTKQERVLLTEPSEMIVNTLPSIEGPSGQNSAEFVLSISCRYEPGGTLATGTYGQPIRATNVVDNTYPKVLLSALEADNAEIIIHNMPVGTDFTIYTVKNGANFDLYTVDSNGVEGDRVTVTSNDLYEVMVGVFGLIQLQVNDMSNIINKIDTYKGLFFDVIRLDNLPGLVFYTVNDGATTFDPSIVKTGDPVDWDLGNGTTILGSNSISYSGYTDSSLKMVRILNIDSMDSVTSIDINSDQIVGKIPSLSNNTALQTFYCRSNQLTGSIPDLSNNTALQTFYCYSNQLTGSIPDLSNNTVLQNFYCYSNQLTGSIPNLSNNTELQYFHCSANQLTGSIPNLSNNIALQYFHCYSNQLTGSIPNLSNNIALQYFHCSTNQLTGSIPDLSNNTALQNFYCYSNQLTTYNGGLQVCIDLRNFEANNNLLTELSVSDIIDDLFVIRAAIGALSCAINVGGTGNSAPDADAVAKIEGTGAYAGDGLKDNGCTVVYN